MQACHRDSNGNSEVSPLYNVEYGTPQGSCLGPLLFIIFCNDLYYHLTFLSCIKFADDTTLYTSGKSLKLIEFELNNDLEIISDWFKANKLTLNISKTVCMIFPPKNGEAVAIDVKLCNTEIPVVKNVKFLGTWLDSDLSWKKTL